jgi:hypothetical protein
MHGMSSLSLSLTRDSLKTRSEIICLAFVLLAYIERARFLLLAHARAIVTVC